MGVGILLMAAMMGVMFLFGHKMGHEHAAPAAPEVLVSSAPVVSTAAPQNTAPAAASPEAEHAH